MPELHAQLIKKPSNLDEHDLIAVLDIYDTPLYIADPLNMTYTKTEIAVNESDGKVQVYVNSNTEEGIEDFKKAYPNAEIRYDDILPDPDRWRVLVFPSKTSDEHTALDTFYKAKHDELAESYVTSYVVEDTE